MNRWAVIAIAAAAAFLGWSGGVNWGDAQRDAILADLPEEKAYWSAREADLDNPSDLEVACEEIFDVVRDYDREIRSLEIMYGEPPRMERD